MRPGLGRSSVSENLVKLIWEGFYLRLSAPWRRSGLYAMENEIRSLRCTGTWG